MAKDEKLSESMSEMVMHGGEEVRKAMENYFSFFQKAYQPRLCSNPI